MIGFAAFIIGLALAAIIIAPFVLLGGWVAMLCFGALAHIFGLAALSIGFWQSCLVALILEILF
jgi:hypothetical protein